MYATVADLRASWRTWPNDLDEDTAKAVLSNAADRLNAEFDIPASPSSRVLAALRIASMDMAKRALLGDGHENTANEMNTAGAFTQQRQFRNSDGALFLTTQERQMLEAALGSTAGAGSFEAVGW